MATKDIRPETVHVTEQAAWARIQELQKAAFEKEGLPGVVQLNNFLAQSYETLIVQGKEQGKSQLLARGIAAGIFITDLLPQVQQQFVLKAASFAIPNNFDDLIPLRTRLLREIER